MVTFPTFLITLAPLRAFDVAAQEMLGGKNSVTKRDQKQRTTKDDSFKDFVLDQLQGLDGVEARRMFGGHGLYRDETFFGILHQGRLYFKVDESTVAGYRLRKMKPFRPNARQTLKTYYQVPVEVIEDGDRLCEWAEAAIRCQTKSR